MLGIMVKCCLHVRHRDDALVRSDVSAVVLLISCMVVLLMVHLVGSSGWFFCVVWVFWKFWLFWFFWILWLLWSVVLVRIWLWYHTVSAAALRSASAASCSATSAAYFASATTV